MPNQMCRMSKLIAVDDTDVIVRFRLNPFQFKEFVYGDEGLLTFHNCCQYRFGVPMSVLLILLIFR